MQTVSKNKERESKGRETQGTQCKSPVSDALSLIGGKWKIAIIYNLREDPLRFGELKRILSPITQQMLTKQLREMERDQLIDRKVYEVIPPKVEYSLTQFGESFMPVLDSLCKWSTEHQDLLHSISEVNQS